MTVKMFPAKNKCFYFWLVNANKDFIIFPRILFTAPLFRQSNILNDADSLCMQYP
jgi:hypothetical protein